MASQIRQISVHQRNVVSTVGKMIVMRKSRPTHALQLLVQNSPAVLSTVGKVCVVEKTNPAQTLLLARDSHVTRRLTLVAMSRAAKAIAALKLLTKKKEVDFSQASATLRKRHSNRKKMYAATNHRGHEVRMLPLWNRLHVESVVPETKRHAVRRVRQLIL